MKFLCQRSLVVLTRRLYSVQVSSPHVQNPLNFLDGQRTDPLNQDEGQKLDLVYPATGEVMRKVQCSGREDVDRAVSSARKALKTWKQKTGFERGQVLKRAADILRSREEEFAEVETLDTGKPLWEARYDIQSCTDSIDYYGGLAASISALLSCVLTVSRSWSFYPDPGKKHFKWIHDAANVSGGSFAYTIREPIGVVGGIGAWNYPFQMATWKSAPALACGNSFVFKPSQLTPLTAVMLGEVYKEAGLPDGCYNVIQGAGETGALLSNHDDVDKMTFTGSVATGSKVMEACARGIKHVSLELGGKSPLIIFDDCDLDNAVTGAMLANFLSQGQVCSNGTRVFVQENIMEEFLKKLVDRTSKMKIGDPFAEDTTVGATISQEQGAKVLKYIEIAKSEGAKVLYGGEKVVPGPKFSGGLFLTPCVLVNCHDNMTVVKDEIFGSVMSVLSFDCEEEVIQRANNTEFGLAGGVFTKDLQRAHRVASQMEAGSLYMNNYNVYPVGVPFGGYKKSGLGEENGPQSLDYYTQVKSVYVEMNDIEAPF